MTYNPDIHHRRSIRLKEYDYSQGGLYYTTICTQNRECLFGIIVGAGSKPALFFKHSEQTELERAGEDRAGLEPAPTGIMHLM